MSLVNPLDQLFNLAPSPDLDKKEEEYVLATEKAVTDLAAGEEVGDADPNAKDTEDVEVDRKIDEVYDAAMTAYNNQMAYTEIIEPRYAARNAEVALTALNIALSAANSRANVKNNRKKTNAFVPYANGGSKHAGNTVVTSRETLMNMIDDAERGH